MQKHTFIFDFDSTIIQKEALEEIIYIATSNHPNQKKILDQVNKITDSGMNGEISFKDSLLERLKQAKIHKEHINEFSEKVIDYLTPGIDKIFELLIKKGHNIFVITGGFIDFVFPITDQLQIPRKNVFANEFILDEDGYVEQVDLENPLSTDKGKQKVVENLRNSKKLNGQVYMIGDGMSDLNLELENYVNKYIGFGINKVRAKVKELAEFHFNSFDDFKNHISNLV